MIAFDVVNWRDLPVRDRLAWAAFRDAQPHLRSPYFDLGWLDAVSQARGDLKVLRGMRAGRAAAFLAFHPGLLGTAQPAGANFGDWCGFVGEPDQAFDARDALARGPSAFRFPAAPAADAMLSPFAAETGGSHGIDLSRGFELYARPEKVAAPKAISNFRRGMRKLEADGRSVRFVFEDRDSSTLEALLALKSAQYHRSGHADAVAWPWSRRLITALLDGSTEAFGVRLSSLWFDDQLAAAHLGLRSGGVMHHWLPAYDPELQRYAPGNLLTYEIAREGAGRGVTEIDFGPGDYTWKAEFANRRNPLVSGAVRAASAAGRLSAALGAVEQTWARLPIGPAADLPGRIARRIERQLAPYAPPPLRPMSSAAFPAE